MPGAIGAPITFRVNASRRGEIVLQYLVSYEGVGQVSCRVKRGSLSLKSFSLNGIISERVSISEYTTVSMADSKVPHTVSSVTNWLPPGIFDVTCEAGLEKFKFLSIRSC